MHTTAKCRHVALVCATVAKNTGQDVNTLGENVLELVVEPIGVWKGRYVIGVIRFLDDPTTSPTVILGNSPPQFQLDFGGPADILPLHPSPLAASLSYVSRIFHGLAQALAKVC